MVLWKNARNDELYGLWTPNQTPYEEEENRKRIEKARKTKKALEICANKEDEHLTKVKVKGIYIYFSDQRGRFPPCPNVVEVLEKAEFCYLLADTIHTGNYEIRYVRFFDKEETELGTWSLMGFRHDDKEVQKARSLEDDYADF